MKTKFNFRSVVFLRAHRIVKESGCRFADALRQAWTRYRVYKSKVIQELAGRINGFDYNYDYSDDHRVYTRWSNENKSIHEAISALPSFFVSEIRSQLRNQNLISKFN